jgi:hypothetical protein
VATIVVCSQCGIACVCWSLGWLVRCAEFARPVQGGALYRAACVCVCVCVCVCLLLLAAIAALCRDAGAMVLESSCKRAMEIG